MSEHRPVAIDVWIPCSERLPRPMDSESGYFWTWDGNRVHMLEIYGSHADEGEAKGFCLDGVGVIGGVTHWARIKYPQPPVGRQPMNFI